jgi:AraC-like DNA-binding protein
MRVLPLHGFRNVHMAALSSSATGSDSATTRRRFNAAVGYGTKMFQSVLRFHRRLAINKNAPRNLARLSAHAGYADQAHMTREVQRFSGRPPTVLLESAGCAFRLSNLLEMGSDADC